MISIRSNVFETNSSSLHALVINDFYAKDGIDAYKKTMDSDVFKCSASMDFSERTFIERNKPEEKASYLFQCVIQHFNNKIYSDKESSQKIINEFLDWTKKTALDFESNYDSGLKLQFTDYSIEQMDDGIPYTYIKYEGWTGCYDNEAVAAYIMPSSYLFMEFIFGKRSVLLQGSDEMSKKDIKKLEKRVKHYMKKGDYRSTVIYPYGG